MALKERPARVPPSWAQKTIEQHRLVLLNGLLGNKDNAWARGAKEGTR